VIVDCLVAVLDDVATRAFLVRFAVELRSSAG
jgi:hypothetical protein